MVIIMMVIRCRLLLYPYAYVVFAAAEKIMTALRNKAVSGTNGKGKGKRRAMKEEVSRLFNKKIKPATSFAWKHKFVCLASTDQSRIPTTDVDKEVLYRAGLGEKEIFFEQLDIDAVEFREILYQTFPKLKCGGGFQVLC